MTTFTSDDRLTAEKSIPQFGEMIMKLHNLARTIDDADISFKVRMLADQLARIGNEYHGVE